MARLLTRFGDITKIIRIKGKGKPAVDKLDWLSVEYNAFPQALNIKSHRSLVAFAFKSIQVNHQLGNNRLTVLYCSSPTSIT